MSARILLTSFDIWLPHHQSNASDDLFTEVWKTEALKLDQSLQNCYWLRKLPVDFNLAPEKVIAAIEKFQPEGILCCGMAETRQKLNIETRATSQGQILETPVLVSNLVTGLRCTEISEDAGNYVCNHLYFSILNYLQISCFKKSQCIFVHVPILTLENTTAIVLDFLSILQRFKAGLMPKV